MPLRGMVLSESCDSTCVATNPNISLQSETPGICETQSQTFDPPQLYVDNVHKLYYLTGLMGNLDGKEVLRAVRIYYRQFVPTHSGPPSFTDVPHTHPFYRFVEALRTEGLTAGCGNDKFCPDAAVTRAQLAAFLATALGLGMTLE